MKKRPELKPGDVCKYSNRINGRKVSMSRDITFVVMSVRGDSQDGHSWVSCVQHSNSRKRSGRKVLRRKCLWFTGRNVNDGPRKKRQKGRVGAITNNDGRTTCLQCGQPTKNILGITATYNCCVNTACKWNGI